MSEVEDDEDKSLLATAGEKSLSETQRSQKDSDSETPAVVEEIPTEIKQSFQSFMAMVQSGIGMPLSPLFNKFTDKHIDKFLDYIQRDDDNEHKLKETNRWFFLAYFIISVAVFSGFVVYLLPKDRDFLVQLITFLVLIAGGIGAGYGIKSRDKD